MFQVGDKVTVSGTVCGGADLSGKIGISIDGAGRPYCAVDPAACTLTLAAQTPEPAPETEPVQDVSAPQMAAASVAIITAPPASVPDAASPTRTDPSEAIAQPFVAIKAPAEES